jgi:diguanylate cyclase (GGDEF)-like protein
MGRLIGWLGWLLVMCCGIASPAAAHGAVGTPVATCVARADPTVPARTLFRSQGRFACAGAQTAYGSGDFDVLSRPIESAIGVDWPAHVRFGSVWQQSATLYALYADGAIARVPLDGQAVSRSLQLGAIIDIRLPYRRIAVTRLLWRIQGSANLRGILLGARTATATEGWQSNLELAGIYAGFIGLCTALLIYNFALWCALRHPFQLAYCAMMASLIVYALSSSGAIAWWWPDIVNNDRLRLNYLMLATSAAAALAFARSFFGSSVFGGWVGRLAHGVSAALIGTALAFALLAPWHAFLLDRLYSVAFMSLLAVTPPVLVRAWRLRRNYLWLFALAWAAPIAFAALRIAGAVGWLAWSFWIDNSTVLAMTCEGLLSSLAIAYRIHLLSRERDEAREQEIAARLLANTDPLTGLLNRRAFLHDAIGRTGDQVLAVVDLDHFKMVNETIGHDGGDEVLRLVARVLRAQAGEDALVARIGGEEFAILADATRAADPQDLLDALRTARMPYDVAVTASIGSCTGPMLRETDWKRLYRCADRALYAAKTAGRDRARDATAQAAA